ncbi:MAG: macro domain-containing protein [candidate division WOR-3 bacterium]
MHLLVKTGDVLDECVDVLICTANPTLAMSGGVSGDLLNRGGSEIQEELRLYLAKQKRSWVEPGSVIQTGPGKLHVKHILHAVGVNAFYESGTDLVVRTLQNALLAAAGLGARTVATPAIATGYGPLTIENFASAVKVIVERNYPPIEELRVIVKSEREKLAVLSVVSRE